MGKRSLTLSIMYDVGGVSFGSWEGGETDGVSRSSKQMPPGNRSDNVRTTGQESTDQEDASNPLLEASMQKEGNGSDKLATCPTPP